MKETWTRDEYEQLRALEFNARTKLEKFIEQKKPEALINFQATLVFAFQRQLAEIEEEINSINHHTGEPL